MKKRLALMLIFLFLSSLVYLQPVVVKAQTKTIVVPDNYPSLTSAIGNASNGDTILLRSGTYEGPINGTISINKSISIIGESAQSTVIKLYPAYTYTEILGTPVSYTYTDGIAMTSDSCVLQNLAIQLVYPGLITLYGSHDLIANCRILSWQMVGITVEGSNCRVTRNNLDGVIQVNGKYNQIDANNLYSLYLGNIKGEQGNFNIISDNTCNVLILTSSSNNILLNNKISGYGGINLVWSDNNLIYKNQVSASTAQIYGLRLWLSSNNVIKLNTFTYNGLRTLELGGAYNNLFALNNFLGNTNANESYVYDDYSDHNYHTYVSNTSTCLWGENNLGNYWDNYKTKYPDATAIDNTQVGNIPYAINENNMDPFPLMSSYDVSSATIQLPDWATNLKVPTIAAAPTFPSFNPSVTPTQTSSISPTPTVPELSWLVIMPLLIAVLFIALTLRHRKTTNLKR